MVALHKTISKSAAVHLKKTAAIHMPSIDSMDIPADAVDAVRHNLSKGSYSASKHLKRVHKITLANILISEQVTNSFKMLNNDLWILDR